MIEADNRERFTALLWDGNGNSCQCLPEKALGYKNLVIENIQMEEE